jgi:hypothetical protein
VSVEDTLVSPSFSLHLLLQRRELVSSKIEVLCSLNSEAERVAQWQSVCLMWEALGSSPAAHTHTRTQKSSYCVM